MISTVQKKPKKIPGNRQSSFIVGFFSPESCPRFFLNILYAIIPLHGQICTLLPVICIVAILLAGCTAPSPVDNQSCLAPTPTITTVPVDNQTCSTDAQCVPAQCCHPTSGVNPAPITVCNLMCTASCEGPLDCRGWQLAGV